MGVLGGEAVQRQEILSADDGYRELDEFLKTSGYKKILLVCGGSIKYLKIGKYFSGIEGRHGIRVVSFSNFQSNPLYDSIVEGVRVLNSEACDLIVAVGGGSAIDVAKCIKLFSNMDHTRNYLEQEIIPNNIKLLVIPTTAGTGSEATHFAVIYNEGEKLSISDEGCIPSIVVMDPSTLESLSDYQRKVTMLDALCHGIESYWSVNSNVESRKYSRSAIAGIMANMEAYLENDKIGNANMLKAANLAGKAINITQTTAGHAMCYKLTSLYGIAHGHAAALCVSVVFRYMIGHVDKCVDPRGKKYLKKVFKRIAEAMGCEDVQEAVKKFDEILIGMGLEVPWPKEMDYTLLRTTVNPARLKNNPVSLDEETINSLYHWIFQGRTEVRRC